jgi:hypothetical protein
MTTQPEDEEEHVLCAWCGQRIEYVGIRELLGLTSYWVHALDRLASCYLPGFPPEWPNHPHSVAIPVRVIQEQP